MATFTFHCPHCGETHPMIWGDPGTLVWEKENEGFTARCPKEEYDDHS